MLLYIIRHGTPDYEKDALKELGIKQAEALGRRLEQSGIDRVFSSPNGRARKTGEPLCRRTGLEMTVEPWLSEDLNEVFQGKHTWCFDEISCETVRSEEVLGYGDEWYKAPVYGLGEGSEARWKEIMRCSDAFTEKLGYRREGRVYRVLRNNPERVAVFCHCATGRLWSSYLLGMHPGLYWSSFAFYTTGVTILDFGAQKEGTLTAPVCLCCDDLSHLYEASLQDESMVVL